MPNKMKFVIRCLLIALVFTVAVLVILIRQLPYSRSHLDDGYIKIAEGLQVNPWHARSLQGVKQQDRARFFNLYNDDRRYFGSGNDTPIALNKHTQPQDFHELKGEANQKFDISKLREIISRKVTNAEGKTHLGNIKRLVIAANEIRHHKNVSSLDFKSVLQIHKEVMRRVPSVEEYGRNFTLSDNEKHTLKYAWPQQKGDAQRIRLFRRKRRRLLHFSPPQDMDQEAKLSAWYAFFNDISRFDMYRETDTVTRTLREISELPITYFDLIKKKIPVRPRLRLKGGVVAWMTPIKNSRTQETIPNHKFYNDGFRHTADIAAFHLDRVLGFRRAPPCVGRTLSIKKDLFTVPANSRTFKNFTSLIGSICLEARCSHCHDEPTYVCGNPENIEGAVELDVMSQNLTIWNYPWRQSDDLNDEAAWESDPEFCHEVRQIPPFDKGRRLLDIIDLAIFDFLQGNMGRKSYHTFAQFKEDTFIIHTKNSQGFGRAYHDEMSILAPLYQCCNIRFTTLQTLLDFELGPSRLSDVMSSSLLQDPLAPVLLKQHLLALDRRLRITLKVVHECISLNSEAKVVILDGL